jgi:hypothetical protein
MGKTEMGKGVFLESDIVTFFLPWQASSGFASLSLFVLIGSVLCQGKNKRRS